MADYQALARAAARRHGLDPGVFARQIRQESGFNPNARSPAGAIGIAQIMPATARGWGVNPRDPTAALDAAAKHMAGYVKQFGSYRDALVAYNAGPGRVGQSLPAETRNYIKIILGGSGEPRGGAASVHTGKPRGSSGSDGGGGSSRTVTTTTPGVDNSAARRSLVMSFLDEKKPDVLDFALQARQLADVPGTMSTKTTKIPGTAGGSADPAAPRGENGGGLARMAASRASAIDAQRLPYHWGGGHGGKTGVHQAVPLDCSGAVSKVLGIDPRVAAQFKGWGRPGDGGSRGVTIAAKDTHVLMKINGHWFGTSATNPGGGAGWIPESAISPSYLAGFTLRHSAQ